MAANSARNAGSQIVLGCDQKAEAACMLAAKLLEVPISRAQELWQQIKKAYGEPHRFYHTLQHIGGMFTELRCVDLTRNCDVSPEMLSTMEMVEDAIHDLPAFLLATLLHDFIYTPGSDSNEVESAVALLDFFSWASTAEHPVLCTAVLRAACMILCTKSHAVPADEHLQHNHFGRVAVSDILCDTMSVHDAKLLVDCDMAILAAQTERYNQYTEQVRTEFAHLSDHQFRKGRHAFLQQFVSPKQACGEHKQPRSLYLTEFYSKHLLARAIANIQAELTALDATSGGDFERGLCD